MTHRLLLLRHAKSSWDDDTLPDRDRPLAARGRSAAERMGAHLRTEGLRPELVLCSSALRTRETLELLALEGAGARFEDGLYGATSEELVSRIRNVSEDVGTAAVIGHNPGMQDLAITLTHVGLGLAEGAPGDAEVAGGAARLREKFPTGALALFEIDGPWKSLAPGGARLAAFVVPRDLP